MYFPVSFINIINTTRGVFYKKKELLTLHEHLGSPLVFGGVCVAHLFSFLYCVFCVVCLPPVFCVPNVAIVSGFTLRFSLIMFIGTLYIQDLL
jgi:hypothetical protein